MLTKTKKFSVFENQNNNDIDRTNHIDVKQRYSIFESIYDKITSEDASKASLLNRKENKEKYKNIISYTLTYGEINDVQPIEHIFQKLKEFSLLPILNGKFYDLGSGTGRPVIAASLLHNFSSCIGIELLDGLYALSLQALEQWKILKQSSKYNMNHYAKDIHFIHGSMFDLSILDWTDGDVVFANSTCYSDDMMEELYNISKTMKIGSIFITLSQPLMDIIRIKKQYRKLQNSYINDSNNNVQIEIKDHNEQTNKDNASNKESIININDIIASNYWKIIGETREIMSWGEADYYIQIKENYLQ